MKKKAYFRADASAQIGYGHFVRSLALADILKDDFDCIVFSQTPSSYQYKEAENVCNLVSNVGLNARDYIATTVRLLMDGNENYDDLVPMSLAQ